jgi:hypothetical protein
MSLALIKIESVSKGVLMAHQEMPIFTRTFDFLTWLLPISNKFPRAQRFSVTNRLLGAAFDLREQLEAANHCKGRQRLAYLNEADISLDKVRLYLRLAVRWEWLTLGQYHHAAKMVAEIGRLLGGWKRVTISQGNSPGHSKQTGRTQPPGC